MSKKKIDWEKVKDGEFGESASQVQSEFQARGLLVKGSQAVIEDKVKIGKKIKYICKEEDCPFVARITVFDVKPREFVVESASISKLFFSFNNNLDLHNHIVKKDAFCTKMLAEAIAEEPNKKPKQILKLIRRKQVPQDENPNCQDQDGENNNNDTDEEDGKTEAQILQSIRNIKSTKNQKGEIVTLDDLEKFYNENKLLENTNHEVFVIDALLGDGNNKPISIVFSSKTCMKFLDRALQSKSPALAIDGTFKLNTLGYPLLCLTTQDANHQMFPIAFAPSSSECQETISFLLNSIIKAYKLIYKKDITIAFFMSDCASYTFAAVTKTFGILKGGHLSCYFHIKDNQRKKKLAEHKVEKEDRKDILLHLEIMHMMFNEKYFIKYWILFKKKYEKYKSYTEYFESTYIQSIFNKWHFFNVPPNTFLTNNICESLNSLIKRDWTNRERKPLHIFFNILKEGLMDLSKEKKFFKYEADIPTEMKLKATQLLDKNLFTKCEGYYFLNKDETEKVSLTTAKNFLTINYNNVDDFKTDFIKLIVVSFDRNLNSAICYCSRGFKYGICHHRLALEMLHGVRNRVIVLVPAKKRGRKKKATPALDRDEEINPVGKKVKKTIRRKLD